LLCTELAGACWLVDYVTTTTALDGVMNLAKFVAEGIVIYSDESKRFSENLITVILGVYEMY
jgi:hypothetical protein